MPTRRRIKKARIRHISLVSRGANQFPVVYKGDDDGGGVARFDLLMKEGLTEDGEVLAVVYAPEVRDSQGDIASVEVVKDMAYEFQRSGQGIDIMHDGKTLTKDEAYVAENFIIQNSDERFDDLKDYGGNPVDVTGGWGVVIKLETEDLRKAYRDGDFNGVSMEGPAEVEIEKTDDVGFIRKALDTLLRRSGHSTSESGDIDMKAEDLTKAIADGNAELLKGLSGVLEKFAKPADGDDDTNDTKVEKAAPRFTGDYSNEADVRDHRKALAIHKAETTIDDPSARFEAIAKIETDYADDTDALAKAAGVEVGDSAELRAAKIKVFKLEQSSKQTDDPAPDNKAGNDNPLLKQESNDLLKRGADIAKAMRGEPVRT